MGNYSQWNNPNISDEEWEQMLQEQDFEYPSNFSSLMEYIKSISDEEMDIFMEKIETLEIENENERLKQLSIMKNYLRSIGVQTLNSEYTFDEIKQKWKNVFCGSLTQTIMVS